MQLLQVFLYLVVIWSGWRIVRVRRWAVIEVRMARYCHAYKQLKMVQDIEKMRQDFIEIVEQKMKEAPTISGKMALDFNEDIKGQELIEQAEARVAKCELALLSYLKLKGEKRVVFRALQLFHGRLEQDITNLQGERV